MNQLRLYFIKGIRWVLVKMGRGGSLPGTIALKLDPRILSKFHMPKIVVMVTGTNGKTTTSNLIVEALSACGLKTIGNRRGDNLREGIVTLLCANADRHYKVQADAVVLEVDELTVSRVFKDLSVTTFVVNNFFRDQLDRAGEMETIVRRIESILDDYQGHLILNADDPNVVRLADKALQASVHFYGVDKTEHSLVQSHEASEGKFCPRCQSPLIYEYYQYSHIGRFHCEKDDFGNNPLEIEVSHYDEQAGTFTVDDTVYPAFQNAIYAIYNCAAVLCVLKVNQLPLSKAAQVFSSFTLKEGRNEEFDLGKKCILNLIKNPTGANEVMKYINTFDYSRNILIILNDHVQDGKDVSWIWDAQFEMLMNEKTDIIICSGSRAYDMALRLKYAGFEHFEIIEDVGAAAARLKELNKESFVISTYTALQPTRAILRRLSK